MAQQVERCLARVIGLRPASEHEALQVSPRREAVLAGNARLRVVQSQAQGSDGGVALASRSWQGFPEPAGGCKIIAPVKCKQLLGLLLQMGDVGPGVDELHGNLRASNADDPQIRLHKRLWIGI
jgi:hypothetical protein